MDPKDKQNNLRLLFVFAELLSGTNDRYLAVSNCQQSGSRFFFLTFRPDPTPRVMDRSCVTHVGAIFAPIHRCEIDSQRLIAARNQSAAFHRHELQGQLALALAARV